LRGVSEIGKNDVCAAEGSDYCGACPFHRRTFLGVSESERGNAFAFAQGEGEVRVSGTENRLWNGIRRGSGCACEERANDCNDDVNVEEGESGTESDGPTVNYTSGACGNADGKAAVVSGNCVHRTVIQMGNDGVSVVESAKKTDGLDAEGKCKLVDLCAEH